MADALTLAELRRMQGMTQKQVAENMGISQPSVSQLERRRDIRRSTLTAYVKALGGELDVTAKFPIATTDA